jgi:ATP synthase I chain
MTPTTERMDARIRASFVGIAVVGAAFSVAATFLWSLRAGWSVAAGAAVAALNVYAIARIVSALVPADDAARPQSRVAWALLAVLKLLGLFSIVGLLIGYGLVSPPAMVGGFATLPFGIAIAQLVSDRSART